MNPLKIGITWLRVVRLLILASVRRACSRLVPRWLAELGCEVLAINDDPTGAFPHRPEPTPETMFKLSAVVKAGRADIGFAHDADGERLGIVTELGDSSLHLATIRVMSSCCS